MKEFIESFINEANDIISNIESLLFKAEEGEISSASIEEIFRGMHTLKGAAGMFDYVKSGELTHELETIYDFIREGELELDSKLINISFNAVDVLRCLLNNQEESCPEQFGALLDELKSISGASQNDSFTKVKDLGSGKEGNKLFYIYFHPDSKVFKRGLDPGFAIEDIKELGNYIAEVHDNDIPVEKQFEEKICNAAWEIYLVADKTKEDVGDALLFYNDDEYKIIELNPSSFKSDEQFTETLSLIYNKKIPWQSIEKNIKELSKDVNIDSERPKTKNSEIAESKEKDEVGVEGKISQEAKKEVNIIQNIKSLEDTGILVSSKKLDEMMNLVSELVIGYSELENSIEPYSEDTRLVDITEKIEKLSKKFRDNALSIRLIPLKTIFQQQQRLVRDLSNQLGKKIEFIAEGLDTELDKSIISVLEKPLLHIIRNSIDHGLETPETRLKNNKSEKGLLRLMSYYSGAHVVVQVQDDGAGINLEKVKKKAIQRGLISENDNVTEDDLLKIIITPGFSTADKVSMISGRGVGMDVVQKEILSIRGDLEINTEKGLGTIITLKIPITLSIIDTLLIEAGTMRFLVPLSEVELCYHIPKKELFEKDNKQIEYEQDLIPFINLHQIFNIPDERLINYRVLIIKKNENKYAIITEKIIGEHQAVLKPLGDLFKSQVYFSGVSILGDGRLAYVLDTMKLASYSEQKLKIS